MFATRSITGPTVLLIEYCAPIHCSICSMARATRLGWIEKMIRCVAGVHATGKLLCDCKLANFVIFLDPNPAVGEILRLVDLDSVVTFGS